MLVCPECQSKNPTHNKFCQKCGTSLTARDCEKCDEPVNWGEQHCPNCGALAAKVGVAFILPKIPLPPAEGELPETPPLFPLDPENRYQLHSADSLVCPPSSFGEGYSLLVWDSQPLQQSYLERQLAATPPPDLEEAMVASPQSDAEWLRRAGVPDIAIPYWVLQEALAPAIPSLYDAWETPQNTVLVLEDRLEQQLFKECWEDQEIPIFQVLYWLDAIAKLWQELAPLGYAQSLLEVDNLQIDEDQTLCLQQLYPDDPESPPDLTALGKLWTHFFSHTGRTLYGPLAELLGELTEGKLTAIEEVRTRLQEFARQQQENFSHAAESPTEEEVAPDQSAIPTLPADPDKMQYTMQGEDAPTVVLPMQLLSLTASGLTHVGGRDHNEDTFGIETVVRSQETPLSKILQAKGIYIVCDGMGGHAAGEVASAMAIETLQAYFRKHWTNDTQLPDAEVIRQGILAANDQIYQVNLQNERSGSGRMGTTLVMLLIQDRNIAIAHVGDSRIYQVTRKYGIEQLTRDHEVGQREILRGVDPEDAYARPDAYQLTQALGPRENDFVKPDILITELHEDVLFLLCSDGLSDGNLLERHYEEYLTPLISSRANLEDGLYDLVKLGNTENGHDNITGVVVRVKLRPNLEGASLL